MARHFKPKQRRTRSARRAVLAGAAAAGVSSALVLGMTTGATVNYDVNLAASVIGVGGRGDPDAVRVQPKVSGYYAAGPTDTYVPVHYPATVLFQSSTNAGVPKLAYAIDNATGTIHVVSYSEGALVAEQVKRDLAAEGYTQSPTTLDFVFIASPYSPNGGIFARFPGFQIPGLVPEFSAAQPTAYNSTYVTNEYDGYADFPAYFNPLSIANAVLGMAYAHPDEYYDGIDLSGANVIKTEVVNDAGGMDTYYFVVNPHLPLLAPIRQIADLTGLTPLTEPVLGAVEPLLRVAVDAGYTDRTNANPGVSTPFSLITPPAKIVEAITQVPGALQEGAGNVTGGQTQLAPANREAAPTSPALNQGTGSQNRSTLDQNDEVLVPPSQAPKKPKPAATKKDPFQAVSSAIKKGLQSTLGSTGNRVKPTTTAGTSPTTGGGTTEVKKADEPSGGAPKSEADAA